MKIGDLVMKRWGKIEAHQQESAGVIVGKHVANGMPNPAFYGYWLLVLYPGSGKPTHRYRPNEFEVISESR